MTDQQIQILRDLASKLGTSLDQVMKWQVKAMYALVVSNLMWAGFWVVWMLIVAALWKKLSVHEYVKDEAIEPVLGSIALAVLAVLSFFVFLNLTEALKIFLAPEAYGLGDLLKMLRP